MNPERGIEKSGYLDVKQPSTTKGRKLKTWKKRWVIVHQMSDLANGKFNAKVDIYPDEAAPKKVPSGKMTFVLENITAVQLSKSKTHPNAFEVVETEPVLVFCAATEQETATWMSIYRRIFQHDKFGDYDIFGVSIIPNNHTKRLNLEEQVLLSINTSTVTVLTPTYKKVVEWKLSTVKRFYTEENCKDKNRRNFIIECGSNSASGEGRFGFVTPECDLILRTIRKNITQAIADKNHLNVVEDLRDRAGSTSTTTSEYHFSNLLSNSEFAIGSRSTRSDSDSSLSSSVFTNCSTPPLSPVNAPKLDTPLITSTPNPTRNLGSGSGNSVMSDPTLSVVEDGYSEIKCNNGDTKPRSGSISSTNSVSSNKSRNSISHDSVIHETRIDVSERKSDGTPLRTVSNSFDSGFSNGSYDETTKRNGSDLDKAIAEESNAINSDSSNVYQELDYATVLRSRLINTVENNRARRHSTGDVTTDSDYAELDSRKKDEGIFSAVNAGPTVQLDTPPALPDRPASVRWSNSIKSKPNWKKRLSSLLISTQSPGHSPERCESPVNNQVVASDIVLDNVRAILCHSCNNEDKKNLTDDVSPIEHACPCDTDSEHVYPCDTDSEHVYQSIPDVLQQTSLQCVVLPLKVYHRDVDRCPVASDILLPTDSLSFDNITDAVPHDYRGFPTLDSYELQGKLENKASPLIDFFFKDDGFEILQAQSTRTLTDVPILLPTLCKMEPEKPLIDFSSSESLAAKACAPSQHEGFYMDMTSIPTKGIQRVESVEYIPPSDMKAAICEENLIDI